TSADLRTLAQSRASSTRSASRSTMGDRLIAASSAYKRAPADSSEPVLIDALPSLGRDLPDHSVRDDPTTLSRLRGSLAPQVLVAERAVSVRLIHGPSAVWPDGSLVAKLRQRPKNQQNRQSCRLCRRCHLSRYRRTVCTAARSETCDQRERGVRHPDGGPPQPQKEKKGRVLFKAAAPERGALPCRRQARRGRRSTSMAGSPWSPAVRR